MTATEIVKVEQSSSVLALYSAEDIDIIRTNVAAPNFTDKELAFCLSVARARNLDPLAKQVYFTKRGSKGPNGWVEKVAAEPTIDGFRVMADRTGEMDGYDDPQWCGPDGAWLDVWLSKDPPAAARVRVYRKGKAKSYSAIARFDEYAQRTRDGGLNTMWQKMPANQLAKCAEALALRKAFPEQFKGLYSHEEMGQAENASNFNSLPREAPKPEVINAPPANVRQLEQPKQKAAVWTTDQVIPDGIMRAMPMPMRELKDIPLTRMGEEDLELVIEQTKKQYPLWKQMPAVPAKALALLQKITLEAAALLAQRQGVGAPPNDAPMDADQLPPPDFDPETGEVAS